MSLCRIDSDSRRSNVIGEFGIFISASTKRQPTHEWHSFLLPIALCELPINEHVSISLHRAMAHSHASKPVFWYVARVLKGQIRHIEGSGRILSKFVI